MKQPNVLLLDLQPSPELGSALRHILESARFPTEAMVNPSFGQSSAVQLRQEILAGHDLQHGSGHSIKELLARMRPEVIFLVSPINLLRQLRSQFRSFLSCSPASQVIAVSEAETPNDLLDLDENGFSDFITPPLKPVDILPRFWRALRTALASRWASPGDSSDLPVEPFFKEVLPVFRSLLGNSQAFLLQANRIPLIAKCDARVIISGETGTGKEVFARAIHRLSARANKPFVALNCGAIPDNLVESELFGHERGSFTGAVGKRAGLVAEADGGTLFLDEIDSLPYYSQVKLLRFLQESEYRAVGSDKNRQADVRVITATNADLDRAVQQEKLRKDLYYRLNIIEMKLPPLRERPEDITLLANHFLKQFAQKFGKPLVGFSAEAMQKLSLYHWPGNVRELENTIERAAALAPSPVISGNDLALSKTDEPTTPQSFQEAKRHCIEQFERNYLQSLLLEYQGNVSRAARAAQKDRGSLLQLLRKYGIKADDIRNGHHSTDGEV